MNKCGHLGDPAPRRLICVECYRKEKREWYQNHRVERQLAMREAYARNPKPARDRQLAQRARKKAVVDAAKSVPCKDCGDRFPTVCMDFDHLGDKVECVAILLVRNAPVERILTEIAKCEVVCSNCHRIRTAARRGT